MDERDEKFARYARYRRTVNKVKDIIWNATKFARKAVLKITGIGGVQVYEGSLDIRIKRNNDWYDFGCVGHKVITTAFAEFVVDQLIAESSVFGDFKYHDIGTDGTAESAADTALKAPVEARTAGSQVKDSSKVYKSIADISITADRAIKEHGIFNHATRGQGTLMDRTVFTTVNLVNGDIFEAIYKLTVSDNT